jgi:predicted lysophospholipase L1 biosynthesis ABC-type transport system permease subunit
MGGRAATAALLFGVTTTMAALTFAAGLERGAADRTLSGQAFDTYTTRAGAGELPADLVAAWRADERVAAATHIQDTVTPIGERSVAVFAVADLKGRFEDHPVRGRAPAADDEITFAPTEMRRLGLSIGDTVDVAGRPMRVVGELFTPQVGHTNYDEGARVTPDALAALVADGDPVKFDSLALRLAPGVPRDDDTIEAVWQGAEHDRGGRVQPQADLAPTRLLPFLLGAFAALLTVGAAAYSIATTARRRRREVAVLQVLGLTRRQGRATVAWHAAAAAAIALVLGLPLGFAIGRTLWQALADGLPLRYVRPDATLAALAVAAGVVLVAVVAAARPARSTGLQEPATLLRAE